jgi:hypothetical protein
MVREARRIGVRFVWSYNRVRVPDHRQRDVPALSDRARDAHGLGRAPAGPPSRLTKTLDALGPAIVTAYVAGATVWLHST